MEIVIHGHNLPGRMFRDTEVRIHEVHVGLQIRIDPAGLVPGDASDATWTPDARVSDELMLADSEPELVRGALDQYRPLLASVDLTDRFGCPACGRVRPAVVTWTVS